MNKHVLLLVSGLVLLSGCVTTAPTAGPGNVSYGDSKAVETVTNQFGSTDLQTLAESMAQSLAHSPAIGTRRPLVTIAEVKNKTSEYIDTRSITDSIRSQLLKSGSVRFAVDVAGMDNQTEELARQNQSGLYKKSKTAKMGRMEGSDYRLEGSITSIVKRGDDIKDVYYKMSLQLISNESGTIEWADEKDIRKTSRK
ncbi:MAG: penicillin-binding protein activator LpoB [Magnetococcales bacterium]|nr:penicillin-binding protein activator LpoB [Magnetococcales bacterium]NGZ28060.1 penicillin-binding protein activator LpoB [Magnetococcales bacterium]